MWIKTLSKEQIPLKSWSVYKTWIIYQQPLHARKMVLRAGNRSIRTSSAKDKAMSCHHFRGKLAYPSHNTSCSGRKMPHIARKDSWVVNSFRHCSGTQLGREFPLPFIFHTTHRAPFVGLINRKAPLLCTAISATSMLLWCYTDTPSSWPWSRRTKSDFAPTLQTWWIRGISLIRKC